MGGLDAAAAGCPPGMAAAIDDGPRRTSRDAAGEPLVAARRSDGEGGPSTNASSSSLCVSSNCEASYSTSASSLNPTTTTGHLAAAACGTGGGGVAESGSAASRPLTAAELVGELPLATWVAVMDYLPWPEQCRAAAVCSYWCAAINLNVAYAMLMMRSLLFVSTGQLAPMPAWFDDDDGDGDAEADRQQQL